MINITTPFYNEIKKDNFTYREYITVGSDTKKILVKAKLFDDCYFEGNFIGTFIMKRIEIETESDIDYKQKEITFYKGVKIGANWEDLKIGTFIVTDILLSDTKETVKITGYDYALKFAQPYVTALNYASGTITLQMVLDEITTALGLSKTVLDINGGFIVDSNQFEGQQYGKVIQAIALSTGNFAKIDQNNNLKFIFKTSTDIVINDYVELEDKRDTHPITIVTLGMSQIEGENVTLRWEQGITLYGEHYLVINDNPFTYTQQKRQQQIQAIFDKIKGFAYSSFSTKSAFAPQVQCGDLVKIKNRAGTLVESIILRYSSDYDDVLLEAPSIIKATVNYQNEPSLELQIKNTQIIVDKQKNEITSLTSQVEKVEIKIEKVKESWRGPDIPTLENAPAINWTTDIIKDGHIDEVYFCDNNGINYIFTKTSSAYLWEEQTDNRIINNQTSINNTNNNINNNYDSKDVTQKKINDTKREVIETTSAMMTQTMNSFKFNLYKELKYDEVTGSITELKNTLITIDIDGLKVNANSSAFNTLMNNVGFYILDGTSPVSKLDKTGTSTKNLVVEDSIKKFGLIIEKKVVTNGVASVKGYWIKGGV